MQQCSWRHIDEKDFICLLEEPGGNSLTHPPARQLPDLIAEARKILDVHRGQHVDASLQQDLNVLPPLLPRRSRSIRMRQLINDTHSRTRLQNGINIDLFCCPSA